MKIKRIALWSTVAFASLLTIVLVWLWTADLGVFKSQFEDWISKETGRELVIDGEFHVDLTRHAVVIAEDVRFQNADWEDEPYMVEVGRLEVRVDLRSLLDGPLLIELIDVDDVKINLTKRENGAPNWDLQLQSKAKPPAQEEGRAGFEVLIDVIDVDGLHLVFESTKLDKPLDLRIEHLDQRHRNDDFLELDVQATLRDREVSLKGELGPWTALLAGQDIHFNLQGQLDTFEIETSGRIDDIGRPHRPAFQFSASSPDINDLAQALGIREQVKGNIDFSGSLMPQDNGPLVLDVRGNIGEAVIEAEGTFSNLQDFEQVDIDLLASGPDLGKFLRLAGIDQVREAPFMIDIDATRQGPMFVIEQGRMVFAEAEFDISARLPDFPGFDNGSIAVQINGPDIERFRFVTNLSGAASGEFSIGFDLRVAPDGRELLELDLTTSLGQINASGQLGDAPRYIGSTFDFQLNSASLARLGSAYGIENLPNQPLSVLGSAILEEGGVRIPKSLVFNVDDVSVSVDGLLVLSDGIVGSALTFNLVGPSLAAVTATLGIADGIPEQPFDVNGIVHASKEGYRLADVTAMTGSSKLDLEGLIRPVSGLAGSNVTFALSGPAFEEIIDKIGDLEVRPGPYELAGKVVLQPDFVQLDEIKLEREKGHVLVNMELGLPVSRRWANFNLSARGNDVRSVFRGVKDYQAEESPFLVDMRGELRESNLFFDKFEIGIADARVQARGDLNFSDGSSSTSFSFTGDIPSLAQLGRFAGRRGREQSITWDAKVTGKDGVLIIEDLDLKLGESDIDGFVRFTKGDVPKLEIDIDSESIVFGALLEEEDFEYDPEPEFDDGRLLPDIVIPFDALKKLDASIDVNIGALTRDALFLRNINLAVELQDGVLDIRDASFDGRAGRLGMRAKLEPAGGVGKASLELVARDFAMGLAEINRDAALTGNLDIKLESTGADVRTLAGNLNGVVFADTRGGRMANSRALHAIYGDMLSEIFSAVNPFYKADPSMNFKCIVISLEVVDGMVTTVPNSFFGTEKLRLTTKSTIDLKTEMMDLNIRSTPQRDLSISGAEFFNPFIEIVGTLAAPRLAVDETGVLISGGAAVATGGLSVLAMATWDRLSRSREPCVDTAEKGRQALGDRFPDFELARDLNRNQP